VLRAREYVDPTRPHDRKCIKTVFDRWLKFYLQVLLSFIITAGLAIIISAIITLHELRGKSEAKILRKLLLSFSDQQIITGIGIQGVGLVKMDSMVPYHFFIIWMLSLLSTATHLSTLLALVNDFKRDWVLRWLRQFLMSINLILSCIFGIFFLMSVLRSLESTLPISCVWTVPSRGAPKNAGISIAGTIGVIAGNCIVYAAGVWYLHSPKQRWLKLVQVTGLTILIAIAIGAAIRVILLSQAFGTPSVPLNNTAEKDWSFGQLLPILLLLLPLMSAIEIIRGMFFLGQKCSLSRVIANSSNIRRDECAVSSVRRFFAFV
jgi:hypothetical protein